MPENSHLDASFNLFAQQVDKQMDELLSLQLEGENKKIISRLRSFSRSQPQLYDLLYYSASFQAPEQVVEQFEQLDVDVSEETVEQAFGLMERYQPLHSYISRVWFERAQGMQGYPFRLTWEHHPPVNHQPMMELSMFSANEELTTLRFPIHLYVNLVDVILDNSNDGLELYLNNEQQISETAISQIEERVDEIKDTLSDIKGKLEHARSEKEIIQDKNEREVEEVEDTSQEEIGFQ